MDFKSKYTSMVFLIGLLYLTCFGLPAVSKAQVWTHTGPREGGSISIHPLSHGVVFLSGSTRTWRSADSGNTWVDVQVDGYPDGLSLKPCFHLASADTVWASRNHLNHESVWFLSEDGGMSFAPIDIPLTDETWEFRQNPFNTSHLLAFTTPSHSDTTKFRESFDCGASWSDEWLLDIQIGPRSNALSDLEFDPFHQDKILATYSEMYAHGDILISLDSGHAWLDPSPGIEAGPNERIDFHPTIPDLVFVMDRENMVNDRPKYQQNVSTDGGETLRVFQDPFRPDTVGVSRIFVLPNGSIYSAYKNGLFKSTDNVDWEHVIQDDDFWPLRLASWTIELFDIDIAPWDEDLIFLNGFCRSMNGGESWSLIQPDNSPYSEIVDVWINRNAEVMTVNTSDNVCRSIDGGLTWNPVLIDCSLKHVDSIDSECLIADPESHYYYYGMEYDLFLSQNGGETWESIISDYGSFVAFDYENPSRIYVNNNSVSGYYITENHGQTWSTVFLPLYTYTQAFFFDPDEDQMLYIATDDGIMRSGNQGFNPVQWSNYDIFFRDMYLQPGGDDALLLNPDLEYRFGFYSHDNGQTISHEMIQPEEEFLQFPKFTPTGMLVSFSEDELFESYDEGLTWTNRGGPDGLFETGYESWDIAENGTIVIAADEETGGIWVGQDVLDVDEISMQGIAGAVDDYILVTTYPNPFNVAATVSVTLQKTSMLTVSVYNLSGQRVRILADREFSAGHHNLVLDCSDLASGTYFIKARVSGSRNSIQKITLLK